MVELLRGSTLLPDFLTKVNFFRCSKFNVLLLAARIFLIHKWNCHRQIWEQTQLCLGNKTSELAETNVLVLASNPLVASLKLVIGISEYVL